MSDKNEGHNKECCESIKKGFWNLWVTIVLSIIIVVLTTCCIVFFNNFFPRESQEVQTIGCATKSQTKICKQKQDKVCFQNRCCNCCCRFVQYDSPIESSENTHITKNSSAAFITFIICASCVLAIAIVCVAVLAINANKSELTRKKLCALYLKFDEIKISELDSEPKDNEIDKKQNKDASEEHKTEYYPKNKAVADIYKAYANAIADI